MRLLNNNKQPKQKEKEIKKEQEKLLETDIEEIFEQKFDNNLLNINFNKIIS
jgi:hypothetical protein